MKSPHTSSIAHWLHWIFIQMGMNATFTSEFVVISLATKMYSAFNENHKQIQTANANMIFLIHRQYRSRLSISGRCQVRYTIHPTPYTNYINQSMKLGPNLSLSVAAKHYFCYKYYNNFIAIKCYEIDFVIKWERSWMICCSPEISVDIHVTRLNLSFSLFLALAFNLSLSDWAKLLILLR